MRSTRILTLSRLYPNPVMPAAGIYVDRFVQAAAALCEMRVVAPVPYCPPLPRSVPSARFRDIPRHSLAGEIEVVHPRFLTGPGYTFHSYEAHTYHWAVKRAVERLRPRFPFDLIHAHLSYPDGVVAARLAERYRIPAVITEHAPWLPWMDNYPRVRRQAVWASRHSAAHIAVSRHARDTITHFTGPAPNLHVIPVGVDGSVFFPDPSAEARDPDRVLFVGRIHRIKGLDVLFQAMRPLIASRPTVRLCLVGGGSFFRDNARQETELRSMVRDLGLGDRVEFAGEQPPSRVAELMRRSAVLVLPSRGESFGAPLVEALACGTPVVATRCGGPEDIVTDEVGILVKVEDPEALAAALGRVLDRRDDYDPAKLRSYALDNFSWERVARRTVELYVEALRGHP